MTSKLDSPRRLPLLSAAGASAPAPTGAAAPSPPLRSTELGAFRFGSKLEMRIVRKMGRAMAEWGMLAEGDRVMVCVSGGKDSYALLDALLLIRRSLPIRFDVFALNLDQGWPAYDVGRIEAHLRTRDVEVHMRGADIAPIVKDKLAPDATPCSLCSRLRRGALYGLAQELGATKIALGHHLDDVVETLMLNLLYAGQLKAMPAVLHADDGKNVVIRPLVYVEERYLRDYAVEQRYPTVRCSCPTCGLPDQKRQVVKRLLSQLAEDQPGLKTQMLAALSNVRPGHLLDRGLLGALAATAGAAGGAGSPSPVTGEDADGGLPS